MISMVVFPFLTQEQQLLGQCCRLFVPVPPNVMWSEYSVHLEMSPVALERLLTTRGSLTYIGSYISGVKGLSGKSQVSRRMWGGWVRCWCMLPWRGSLPPGFFKLRKKTAFPAAVFKDSEIICDGQETLRVWKHLFSDVFWPVEPLSNQKPTAGLRL